MGKFLDKITASGKPITDEARELIAMLDEMMEAAVVKDDFTSFTKTTNESIEGFTKEQKDAISELKGEITNFASKLDAQVKGAEKPIMVRVREILANERENFKNLAEGKMKSHSFKFPNPLKNAATDPAGQVGDEGDVFPLRLDPTIGRVPYRESNILDLINVRHVTRPYNQFLDELPLEGEALNVLKGEKKPYGSFRYEEGIVHAFTIAFMVKAYKYDLMTEDFLRGDIYYRIRREIRRKLCYEILFGGSKTPVGSTEPAPVGIWPIATTFNAATSGWAGKVTAPDLIDVINAMSSTIVQEGRRTVLLSRADYGLLMTEKNALGTRTYDPTLLSAFNVEINDDMTAGQILVGIMPRAQVQLVEDITVEVIVGAVMDGTGANVVGTDGEFNFVTFRGECHGNMIVKRNDRTAFVKGDIETIKAAIAKPAA